MIVVIRNRNGFWALQIECGSCLCAHKTDAKHTAKKIVLQSIADFSAFLAIHISGSIQSVCIRMLVLFLLSLFHSWIYRCYIIQSPISVTHNAQSHTLAIIAVVFVVVWISITRFSFTSTNKTNRDNDRPDSKLSVVKVQIRRQTKRIQVRCRLALECKIRSVAGKTRAHRPLNCKQQLNWMTRLWKVKHELTYS